MFNSSNQQGPGKILIDRQRLVGSTGAAFEVLFYETSIMDNGILRKERVFENHPPLADGRIVKSIELARECMSCFEFVHRENVTACLVCEQLYCRRCRLKSLHINTEYRALCPSCAVASSMGFLKRFNHKFWTLE